MRRIGGAFVAAAVGLAGLAGLAAAGSGDGGFGGLSTEKRVVTKTTHAQTETVRVICPAGKAPVSAGFKTTSDTFSGPVVTKSVLTRARTKTTATEFNPGNHALTGYANCASRAPAISREKQRVTVPPNQSRKPTAKCPQGERLVGGGFKTKYNPSKGNFTGNIVYASRPARNGWRVAAQGVNSSTAEPTRLTAIAYCADVPALEVNSRRVPGSEGPTTTATAQCGGGEIAIAGGFKSSRVESPKFDATLLPNESRRKGQRSWTAAGVAPLFSETGGWKTYVLCADA